ncbi:MAG: MFS transporter, partial [Betaproteobacteria bacterium]
MFNSEASYWDERRSESSKQALEYYADINERTRLYDSHEGARPRNVNDPKPIRREKLKEQEIARPSLFISRALLDFNEHFIELSNAGEYKRSLTFMIALLFGSSVALPAYPIGLLLAEQAPHPQDWYIALAILLVVFACATGLVCFLVWPHVIAPAFFTALRARYRFNRTTRKVYVLRPKKYGGNAILDWDRVKAHVKWAPPKSWTVEQLASSEEARRERRLSAGIDSNLLLYWPPLDPADSERKGEDLIWVGPGGSGEPLWQYIRTFMEEGMDAVPKPAEYNWLRKGFHTPGQHMEETVLGPSRVL